MLLSVDTQEIRKWNLQVNANSCRVTDLGFGSDPIVMDYGARDNSIYIAADGLVGFGTSNPQRELHVVGGNTPALRLKQDTSESFPAKTWGIEANDRNFVIQDVDFNRRPFKIQSAAPNNTLYLALNGSVGAGTDTPNNAASATNLPGRVLNLKSAGTGTAGLA